MADKLEIFQELIDRNAVPERHREAVNELISRGVLRSAGSRAGPAPDVQAEAEQRIKDDPSGGFNLRLADNLSIGAFTPVTAGIVAGAKTAGKFLTGQEIDPAADYRRERDVQDEILRRSREGQGVAGTAGEIALTLPMMAGNAAVRAPAAAGGLAKRWIYDPAKAGATYGAIYGANSARGGVGEHLENTAVHGGLGALLGPALNAGLQGIMNAPGAARSVGRYLTGRRAVDVTEAQSRLAEFANARVTPYGPEVTPSGVQAFAARNIAPTMAGGQLRAGAQRTIGDIESRAQEAIAGHTGGLPANDLGQEAQQTLRRNLIEHSRPSNILRGAGDDELAGITSASPRPVAEPVPPTYGPDILPRPIHPSELHYEKFRSEPVEQPDIAALTKGFPTVDEMPVASNLAQQYRDAWAQGRSIQDVIGRMRAGTWRPDGPPSEAYPSQRIVDVYKRLHPEENHPGAARIKEFEEARVNLRRAEDELQNSRLPSPQEIGGTAASAPRIIAHRRAQEAYQAAGERYRAAEANVVPEAMQALHGNPQAAERLLNANDAARAAFEDISSRVQVARQAEWERTVRARYDEVANKAQDEYRRRLQAARDDAYQRTESARDVAVRKANQEVREEAAAATARARQQADREAERATAERQADLDRRWQADRRSLEFFEPGRSRESYPTEFGAAYTLANRGTPTFQRNPLGGHGPSGSPGRTATETFIDELGVEARRAMRNSGYREGQPFGASGRDRIGFEHQSYINDILGADIGKRIEALSVARSKGQLTPGPQGLRELMTAVRRAAQDAERPPYPGQPRTDRAAALRRLEGALREDYHRFLRDTGPAGEALSRSIGHIDNRYRSFINDLRRPLEKIYGPKVAPLEAMDRLVAAVHSGDLTTIRPFMRVMSEKSDPTRGAAAIIAHATNGARSMPEFLDGYRAITPEVRNVIFASNEARVLRNQLDRLEGLAERMLPYQKAITREESGGGVIRHVPIGVAMFYHFLPSLFLYGGASGLSRFFSSPRYIAWLTQMPMTGSAREVIAHIDRLGFITSRDSQYEKDFKRTVSALRMVAGKIGADADVSSRREPAAASR